MSSNSNQNGPSLPPQVIILLCLIGAGALVVCAYAVGRHYFASPDPVDRGDGTGEDGMTQAQYMRMVRLRNQEHLQRLYGYRAPPARAKGFGAGSSVESF